MMGLTFYWYPNCSTCRKAKKWLGDHNIQYEKKHIVEETPTKEEVLELMEQTDLPPRRFFNTSGKVYREQNMKDKIKDATNEEMATFLSSNGMLIRRPIITDGKKLSIGFDEETYKHLWQ